MHLRANWRRNLVIAWACALAFGLSFTYEQAEAAHAGCGSTCRAQCGGRNCDYYVQEGCTCYYYCADGDEGSTTCVD